MRSFVFRTLRQVLNGIESIHNTAFVYLNSTDYFNKRILFKAAYFEEELRTYSPVTIIIFAFLLYFILIRLMKIMKKVLKTISKL